MTHIDLSIIKCVVFDFGFTLSSDLYFKTAPPDFPHWRDVIQQRIFDQESIVRAWMCGDLSLTDVARIVGQHIDMPVPVIVDAMKRGCANMTFNAAVWNFACAQRAQGRKTALVTANMDVFTDVVVPSHRLDQTFDFILNTADCRELRKDVQWERAFTLLGDGIAYNNSLLIEDGSEMPALFQAHGGAAHEYKSDELFQKWLRRVGWNDHDGCA